MRLLIRGFPRETERRRAVDNICAVPRQMLVAERCRQLFKVIQTYWRVARRCFNKGTMNVSVFARSAFLFSGSSILRMHSRREFRTGLDFPMKDHGQIPAGAFVAMRTDWSKRWPDTAKMENKDANGIAHYPGWSLAVLKYPSVVRLTLLYIWRP